MLERLYRRSVPPDQVTTSELTRFLCECSVAARRQVGVLLDRRGHIQQVVVGDANRLVLPELERSRARRRGRLSGVRLLHSHLDGSGLDHDDLTDLTLLSLDLVAVVTMDTEGRPDRIQVAHLLPPDSGDPSGELWSALDPVPWHRLDLKFDEFLTALEDEFRRKRGAQRTDDPRARAILVHVDDRSHPDPAASMAELRELARTAGVRIVDELVQRRRAADPRYVMGRGKLEDLVLRAMHREVELVIFDRDLSPSQGRAISDLTELKIIDRTQLILDIFAQRAQTRAGKRRVELAQLKYALPRLVAKNTAMSRLMGGIGGRGPGETKLELNRRLAQKRIRLLEKEIDRLGDERARRRRLRERRRLPVIGIVGYTNAGKSTLLNALTNSDVIAEDKLFATLDPTSRRLRFPAEREVILTDTVGFIRDLPPDLVSAFLATLEELQSADLLLHVLDASSPYAEAHVEAVKGILEQVGLQGVPRMVVFNKIDRVEDIEALQPLLRLYDGIPVCALKRRTLRPLLSRASRLLWPSDDAPAIDEPLQPGEAESAPTSSDGVTTERVKPGGP